MIRKIIYIFRVLFKRGIGFVFNYFYESYYFDLRRGTDTSARVIKEDQTIISSVEEKDNGLLYVASFTSVIINTVNIAKEKLGDERFYNSQFVDLGCGKGKTLIVHAENFDNDQRNTRIGIEYDPVLVKIAKDNIEQCRFSKSKIDIVADSAVNFKNYISSKELVVYLYNSFQGKTLRSVLDELSSIPHILIYVDPAEKSILENYEYTITKENIGKYNADTWLVASSNLK